MSVLMIILLCALSAFGQMDFWPWVLAVPVVEEPGDSNSLDIMSEQKLRMNIYKTRNSILVLQNDSLKRFKQQCNYDLSDDNSLRIQNHYWDLTGSYARKKFPFTFSSLGFEWIPTAVFNRLHDTTDNQNNPVYSSNGIGSVKCGPTIGINYINLPIHLSGGAAVDVWHSALPNRPGWHNLVNAHGDPGFYGALTIGDNRRQMVEGVPFYAQGSIFGRYMNSVNNSRITNGEINTLFFTDVAFADSLFLYCADTLSKGRSAFLSEQIGEAAKYISTPNRTNNSLQATCGIKNIGSLFIRPTLAYTWKVTSLAYPAHENILGDERLMTHTVSVMGTNDTTRYFKYYGGISFAFENEDWLFKDKLPIQATVTNKDSLVKNLQDYDGFNARMFHTVAKEFNNGLDIRYSFLINRYKKEYPNYYTEGSRRIRFYYDKDNMFYTHSMDVILFSLPRVRMSLLGMYSKNEIVYLKKQKSNLNKAERTVRLETTVGINPDSSTGLKETIGAYAKWDEYYFPEEKESGPPLSRKFYSHLFGTWLINSRFMLEGHWDEIFSQDAHFLKDSLNPSRINVDSAELEIESLESSLKLHSTIAFPNNFSISIGNLFKYIYYRNWIIFEKDKIYYMMPFIEMNAFLFNRCVISSRIERYIDPGDDDYWEAKSIIKMMF